MAISFQCEQCGKQYQLGDNLAGKRIKCKECGHAISVPAAASASPAKAAPAATIAASCGSCGKQFQVKAELAGKRVKCQQCGGAVAVPGGSQGAAPTRSPAAAKTKQPASASPPAAARTAAPPAGNVLHSLIDEEFAAGAMPTLLTSAQMYCPKCKSIIPANAFMCVKCGYKLESGRMTSSNSEANRPVRKPGTMSALGVIAGLVGILYSLVAVVVFGLASFGAADILFKLGLPSDDNPESAIGMFGGPVFLLLFTAGFLLFISSINTLRKVKGAIPNAALASKIFVGSFVIGVFLAFASTLYQQYMSKPAENQPVVEKKESEDPPVTFTGPAAVLLDTSMSLALTVEVILTALLALVVMITPPVYILVWASSQGKRLDWEFPEPVYKATRKETGAPPDTAKKPPAAAEKGAKK